MKNMKANELMIGDWIQRNGKNFKVTSIMDGYISTDEHSDSHDYHFNPIPLTLEILEKNGFVQDDSYSEYIAETYSEEFLIWHYYADELIISYDASEELVISYNLGHPCKEVNLYQPYVHELQHALRLCGLHDLADNFKV